MTKHRRMVGLVTITLLAAVAASVTRSPPQSSLTTSTISSGGDVRVIEPRLAANVDAQLHNRAESSKSIRYQAVIENWKRYRASHSSN